MAIKAILVLIVFWHTASWLDHCVCTADAHDSLDEMKIIYDLATTDHISFSVLLNLLNVPMLLPVDSNPLSGTTITPSMCTAGRRVSKTEGK